MGRLLARAPNSLYRVGLGWLLGHRFVLVRHVGRRTGLPRRTVLEVVGRGERFLDVAAAWGPRSGWFRNVAAEPRVFLDVGRRRGIPARAEVLAPDAAAEVLRGYANAHPLAARALAALLRLPFDDPGRLAGAVPVVRFHLPPSGRDAG